ncbi:MAG: acetyl-coenzyme A synthetase N-terminal domain-containing protein [Syntrophomonadaceae bacterium]|nr:acetyl-coenzyme A synthetase N-terminal domain-containing protein [Syntrophomonadaceae bacterium]
MHVLWQPSQEQIQQANLTRFIKMVNQKYSLNIKDYSQLYDWSTQEIAQFWDSMWQFGDIIASQNWEQVMVEGEEMTATHWFPGARLNFAENLLRYRDEQTALLFRSEMGSRQELTYAQLYQQVSFLAQALRQKGIRAGIGLGATCLIYPKLLLPCWLLPVSGPSGPLVHPILVSKEW